MWIKAEMASGYWQERLNIHYGMSKEEAFENFRAWRENKKTCLRCEDKNYAECCPIYLVCKEADKDERSITRDVDRGRDAEAVEHKALRVDESKARKRPSIR